MVVVEPLFRPSKTHFVILVLYVRHIPPGKQGVQTNEEAHVQHQDGDDTDDEYYDKLDCINNNYNL